MGKVHITSSTDGTAWAFSPAEVAYSPIGMCYGDDGFSSAEEAQTQITNRTPGVIGGLSVVVGANTLSTAGLTVITRKNGGNGSQTISVAASATGIFSDLTNTDTLASGDLFNSQVTADSGGTGSAQIRAISAWFYATDGSHTVQFVSANDGNPAYSASTTSYQFLSGDVGVDTTENRVKMQIDVPGKFRNFQVLVAVNTRSTTNTFRTRVNNANGNQLLSVTSGSTGLFEDVSNNDVVVAFDDVNYEVVIGSGSGNLGPRTMSITFVTTGEEKSNVFASIMGGQSKTAGQTLNSCIGGMIAVAISTEATVQQDTNFNFTATRLKCYINTNPFSGTSTFKFRKNGADGNQTISIGAGATGFFEDTTNSDICLGTDEVNVSWTGGTTGTGGIIVWYGMLINSAFRYRRVIII